MRQFLARHHRKLMYVLAVEGVVVGLIAGTAFVGATRNGDGPCDYTNGRYNSSAARGCDSNTNSTKGYNGNRWSNYPYSNQGDTPNHSVDPWSSADYSRSVQANNSGGRGPGTVGWGGYLPDSTPYTTYVPQYPFNGNGQQTSGAAATWNGGPAPTNTEPPAVNNTPGGVNRTGGGSVGTTGVNGYAPQYPFNSNGQQVSGWTSGNGAVTNTPQQPRQVN